MINDPVKEAVEIINRYAVTQILIRQWFMNVLGYLLLEVFTTLIFIGLVTLIRM